MASFLGKVHFEELPTGRVRCVETGHEMPAAEREGYGHSKNCRRALFDLCLAQRKPPLNVFEQSPTSKDKVICKLTGDLLNKSEDALWKHMNGKKFQRKLAQKEAEKKAASQQRAEVLIDVRMQLDDIKNLNADQGGGTSDLPTNLEEDDNKDESMDWEDPGFWVPPTEDRDNGHCEDAPSQCIEQRCESGCRSDEDIASMGIKRKAKKGPSRPALQKKKRKSAGSSAFVQSSSS